jgi:uncharacterized protein (DUF1501 family)
MNRHGIISRRGFLRASGASALGVAGMQWLDLVSLYADDLRKQGRACILLWMAGGPSQFETLDPKPGAETQGPTKAISTNAPGLQIAEHWQKTAKVMDQMTVVRSITSREGNHGRATYLLHTGYAPSGGITHPGFGSIVASELGDPNFDLPHFVSISGPSQGPSYLGVQYAPFLITDPNRPPDNLPSPVAKERMERRLNLLKEMEKPLSRTAAGGLVKDHQTLYDQTSQLVRSPKATAFDLARETNEVRDAYGRSAFGQGCLMARRLVEAGVTFVEVQSSGWDTHGNELEGLKKLIPPVDQGFAALIADLKQRGMLDKTLVIWMGEFGRTPKVNLTAGRDHYPRVANLALAGAGIKQGHVVGATDKLGIDVTDRPIQVPDLFCTFCHALGINPRRENQTNVGRPLKIQEAGEVVKEVFG